MADLDEKDHQLIAALRHDARAAISDLAVTLGLSRTTVRARLQRLRAAGVIVGFSVVLKQDVTADAVRALMMIGIEGRGSERIKRQILGLPEIRALHATNGRWDVIAELGTANLESLDRVLNRIRQLEGVMTSETSLLLSTQQPGR